MNIGEELISSPAQNHALSKTNTRRFQEGTKIDLTIVVPKYYEGTSVTDREVLYYINGEVAGYTKLDSNVTTLNQVTPALLTFGGDGAVLSLFDVRYWNRPLTSLEVFHTYTMSLDSSVQINNIFKKNSYYTEESQQAVVTLTDALNYGKWLASQGTTNFAVWVSTNLCNEEDGVLPTYDRKTKTSDLTTRGEGFYYFRFTRDSSGNGIIDTAKTFYVQGVKNGNGNSSLRFRRQGTSTADSTKSNIRVDIEGSTAYPVYLHRFISEAAGFSTEPESVFTSEKVRIWQIPDEEAIPCYLLTLKKNPNDSTQARNLPTAKWYEDCARYLATQSDEYMECLTQPQRVEYQSIVDNRSDLNTRAERIAAIKTRQCVDGIPSVGFRLDYSYVSDNGTDANLDARFNPINNSVTSFAGQFDAITDKTNMDVFGFGLRNTQDASGTIIQTNLVNDEDFSVEWRNNGSDACCFQTNDLSGMGAIIDYNGGKYGTDWMEYRYPKANLHPWQDNAIYGNTSIGMESDGPIQRLFDLVNTCSPLKSDPTYSAELLGKSYWNGAVLTNAAIVEAGGTVGYLPRRNGNGSIRTWVADNLANRKAIFREELGYCACVKQFLLNALLIDAGCMVDQDVKNQFFTYFTGETDTYGNKRLRMLGYDFDSSWGMDNDDNFRFKYTVKYDDGLYDGQGSKSNLSMLWKLVYDCFHSELVTMASMLYAGGFLRSTGIDSYMFTNEVDIYNSMIYNANSKYSYMGNVVSDWTKVHGSAREHNKWFVEGRMYFMGSRYYASGSDLSNDQAQFEPKYVGDGEAFYSNPFLARRTAIGSHGLYWELGVTAYERTGAAFAVGTNTPDYSVEIDVTTAYDAVTGLPTADPVSETRYIGTTASVNVTQSDFHTYVFGCKHLKTITGLPNLFIGSITSWGNLVNLESLELGSTESIVSGEDTYYYENPFLTSLNINEGVIFGSCKNLNLAGLSGLTGVVSLTAFPILETFEGIRMDSATTIVMPAGSSLRSVRYPKNMTSWTLDNKPNLTSIAFEGYSSIQSISVTNSSQNAATKAIELLNNLMD